MTRTTPSTQSSSSRTIVVTTLHPGSASFLSSLSSCPFLYSMKTIPPLLLRRVTTGALINSISAFSVATRQKSLLSQPENSSSHQANHLTPLLFSPVCSSSAALQLFILPPYTRNHSERSKNASPGCNTLQNSPKQITVALSNSSKSTSVAPLLKTPLQTIPIEP